MKEIKRGDKVFWETKCLWWKVVNFGIINHVGENYVLVGEYLWCMEDHMMQWCTKYKKGTINFKPL
jgi:hypothetical protein